MRKSEFKCSAWIWPVPCALETNNHFDGSLSHRLPPFACGHLLVLEYSYWRLTISFLENYSPFILIEKSTGKVPPNLICAPELWTLYQCPPYMFIQSSFLLNGDYSLMCAPRMALYIKLTSTDGICESFWEEKDWVFLAVCYLASGLEKKENLLGEQHVKPPMERQCGAKALALAPPADRFHLHRQPSFLSLSFLPPHWPSLGS